MTERRPGAPKDSPTEITQDGALTAEFLPATFNVGSKISGRFRIEKFLGRGAFGEVFRAHDEVLGRSVALKAFVLKKQGSQGRVETALEEARTIAKLDHPNIVSVFDVGREGDAAWMAMRLVPGEGLDTLLAREGKIELKRAAPLLRQVSKALDHAHRKGVIHRDVKPSNILVEKREDGSEHVWLADFGIAEVLAGEATPSHERLIAGTPSYMSPEQIAGKRVDARSDIFALGCVAYELITGERAFPGETQTDVMYRVVHDQPAQMGQLSALAGKKFDSLCRRALAKFPEDRYQTVEQVMKELEDLERDDGKGRATVASVILTKIFRTGETARWDGVHLLAVHDLYKTYKFRRKVLCGISLTVKTGSIYALLGRNGSGKTTFIRTCLGIYRKDSGSISIFGRDPFRDGPAVLGRLGYVPETFVAYDTLTIGEMVQFLRAFYPRWDNAYFYQLLGRYELPLDAKIRDFSKGMKTKVSLLSALSHRPEFLLLDDPTIGLDAVTLAEVFETLQDVSRQEGTTVFISSHNIDEVEQIATHIGFLKDGKMLLSDTLDGLRLRTREVRLTFRDDVPPLPAIEQFKPVKSSGRRLTGVVFDTSSGALEKLKALSPMDMDVRELTLKEIFVNLLR
ncbi:MAG: protein kinase [Terriglobia bacterium]|jgi:ABC-type multidrug transport system ATPase subunit/tRNA A-37 threonylcarbamoyl transferase component Bud32